MARWYATFDNSTVSALESTSTGYNFERLTMTGGASLKSNLISTRLALSNAMYAVMDAANKNGANGTVVPQDGYTRGGGNLSFTDLYTNSGAIWPADPRTRPTAAITVAGSSVVSPTDSGTITESLYTDAQTAVQNALAGIAGGGPYARLGLTPWRTLASLWHDHDLTYFAWDDFTPGQPGSVSPNNPPDQSAASDLTIVINWSLQYAADRDCTAGIYAILEDMGNPGNNAVFSPDVDAGDLSDTWVIPGGTLPAGLYKLDISVTFKDPTIPANEGTPRTYSSGGVTPFIELT